MKIEHVLVVIACLLGAPILGFFLFLTLKNSTFRVYDLPQTLPYEFVLHSRKTGTVVREAVRTKVPAPASAAGGPDTTIQAGDLAGNSEVRPQEGQVLTFRRGTDDK